MSVSIVVPTYNEKENIVPLIERIDKALTGQVYEVVVVDDDSPDGTADVATNLAERYPVTVIRRKGVRGLGSAILTGFRMATGDILGVIDADQQHPPEVLPRLVQTVVHGSDIAVASRYTRGGGVEGWSMMRRTVSRGATLLARPLTGVKDPMSGCFMMTKSAFDALDLHCEGYKVLLEILVKSGGGEVREVPYTFECRRFGESKLTSAEYLNYLRLLGRLYFSKCTPGLRRAKRISDREIPVR